MFDWLFSLFQRQDKYDLFSVNERKIFTYFDGTYRYLLGFIKFKNYVKADPIVLYKRYAQVGPDIYADEIAANSVMKNAPEAHSKMIERIRGIFDIKPYEKGGLTEAEVYLLMVKFVQYTELVKKNSSQSQTTSQTSVDSTPTLDGNAPPTTNTSDSGSVEKDQNIEKPESLPSGPKLPTDQSIQE